jgi:hypothetical protein
MTIYQTTSASASSADKSMLFSHEDKFLCVSFSQNQLHTVQVLTQTELEKIQEESHYFDVHTSYNLLPKLSEEMIDEAALTDFMNWTPNQKVYRNYVDSQKVEVQFQTASIANLSVSRAIPSVLKHHMIELMLSVSNEEGVFAFIYQDKVFVTVHQNGRLALSNSFQAKTDEEVIYYLLLVFQEMDLSQEEMPVFFYGNFPEKPEQTKNYLSAYIRNNTLRNFDKAEAKYQGVIQLALDYHENH